MWSRDRYGLCNPELILSHVAPHPTPTLQVYAELQQAFDHFNRTLYDHTLPPCLITLTQKKRSRGTSPLSGTFTRTARWSTSWP